MHNLPIELVKAIVENVSDAPDLFHMRAVNASCRDLITADLFRTVCIQNSVKSAQNIQQVFNTPSLASHVREVLYDPRDNHPFRLLAPSGAQGPIRVPSSSIQRLMIPQTTAMSLR